MIHIQNAHGDPKAMNNIRQQQYIFHPEATIFFLEVGVLYPYPQQCSVVQNYLIDMPTTMSPTITEKKLTLSWLKQAQKFNEFS